MLKEEQISGKVLDHLGLVASTIKKIGLIDLIDERLPVSESKGAKVSMGNRVAAMIINALGFMDTRLYMFSDFLENKPIERFFQKGITHKDFTDDSLGRALDAIYDYGTTSLFSQIAFSIGKSQNLLGKNAHCDTTTLSVYGDYEQKEEERSGGDGKAPEVTYGYSKARRPDLKQVVLHLATTGAAGMPIWMESHAGNASDQKVLKEAALRMQDFCQKIEEGPSFLYVADSAMYPSCLKDAEGLIWLSRVPERLKKAKEIVEKPDDAFEWVNLKEGYRICVMEKKYRGIQQRWCLVSSAQALARGEKSLNRNIAQEKEVGEKNIWHLSCKQFACEKDALNEAEKHKKAFKYHIFSGEVVPIQKYEKKGRPEKNATKKVVGYQFLGKITEDKEKIARMKRAKGRFILATNQLDKTALPDDAMLSEYKLQSKTESGFRFIKDNTFEVSSIFLKTPSRISALMMVMTLTLMVYSIAQHQLRKALEKNNQIILGPEKRVMKKPSLKYLFKLFQGIQLVKITTNSFTQELVINLKSINKTIIGYFGEHAASIYDLSG